jgi:hypothetical protein
LTAAGKDGIRKYLFVLACEFILQINWLARDGQCEDQNLLPFHMLAISQALSSNIDGVCAPKLVAGREHCQASKGILKLSVGNPCIGVETEDVA